MIFSPQRNFCFIHVPKTGGTSIEYAYSQAVAFGDIILDGSPGTMSRFYLETLNLGRHASAWQIADIVGLVAFQSMFSVAVIRDPVERMISYFRWIQSFEHQGDIEKRLKRIRDFHEFIEPAAESLAPQVNFVSDPVSGEKLAQILIPYTHLNEGWSAISDLLGITFPLEHRNKSLVPDVTATNKAKDRILDQYVKDGALYQRAKKFWDSCQSGSGLKIGGFLKCS